ncbi:PREDICTED: protein FAM57A-like [Priapulus caudatus]|uniref:Protein FAM57A-like n=1 Tax=Priapulus caudatus TaxID=37621 RepID=A0ABM1EMP2_PRICU|nr:PREDICTED: protein FAM57A-like [Priapulus caudatus]
MFVYQYQFGVLLVGTFFFPLLYISLRVLLQRTHISRFGRAIVRDASNKAVSTIQAILCVTSGAIIVANCHDDVMNDRHHLATDYAWFGCPYMLYDVWSMYDVHRRMFSHVEPAALLRHFLCRRGLFIVHHLVLLAVFFPLVVHFRHDRGDFFVGCFYLAEFSTPFVSARSILAKVYQKSSCVYLCNGLAMVVAFVVCRVALFPFMYWCYGQQVGLSIAQVVMSIPLKCNVGCATVLLLQLYWLSVMLVGTYQVICGSNNEIASQEKQNSKQSVS